MLLAGFLKALSLVGFSSLFLDARLLFLGFGMSCLCFGESCDYPGGVLDRLGSILGSIGLVAECLAGPLIDGGVLRCMWGVS